MPTDTFNKLPKEKKEKILVAAKREFTRATLKEASIKNIVEEAGIARGSFYQYFDSKDDLLQYLLKEHAEKMNENIENAIKSTKGDIFEVFIAIYNYMVQETIEKKEEDFIKKILEDLKTSQDDVFVVDLKRNKPKRIEEYYNLIDIKKLKIDGEEEFALLVRILHAITIKAVVCAFKYESKEKAKEDYLKQIEYIKYGVLKKGEKDV